MAGITKERAFTQLKSKVQASELRSQMQAAVGAERIVISAPNAAHDDNCDRAATAYLSLYGTCAPLDIEECINANRYESGCSTPRMLYEFPPDDLELSAVDKHDNAIDPIVGMPPSNMHWSHVDGPTKDVVSAYQKSYSIVHRRYEQYSFGHVYERLGNERTVLAQSLPRQLYEIDVLLAPDMDDCVSQRASYTSSESTSSASAPGALLSQSQGDCMLPGAAARLNAAQLDINNATLRARDRFDSILQLLPLPADADVVERRSPAPFPGTAAAAANNHNHNTRVDLMLRVHAFSIAVQIEPLFLSLAVFDAKRRRRLSENFYFDFNGPELLAMIQHNRLDYVADACMSKAKSALVTLAEITEHVCILIRVEKVLQALDVSEAGEMYAKDDPNHVERSRYAAYDYCTRLGGYRMPLAWTVLDLTKFALGDASQTPHASMKSSVCGNTSLVSSLYAPSSAASVQAGGGATHSLPVTPTKGAAAAAAASHCAAAAAAVGNEQFGRQAAAHAYAGDDTDSIVSVERDYVSTTARTQQQHDATINSDTSSFIRVGSGTSFNKMVAKRSMSKADGGAGANAAAASQHVKDAVAAFVNHLQPTTVTLNLYRMDVDRVSDDELLRIVSDSSRNPNVAKRLKLLPARLTLELCNARLAHGDAGATELAAAGELPNQISPEQRRLSPFYASGDSASGLVVQQLYNFPVSPVYAVNTEYRNTLFVYPKLLNLSASVRTLASAAASGSARNMSIRVELWRGRLGPVDAVYGRSNEPPYKSAAYTAVQYHHRSPQLYDEIKVRIPIDLCDEHHLLFTFYHVSCKAEAKEIQTPIGYTWVPLFANKTLATGDYELPISLETLPDSYYHMPASVHLPNLKWLDNHRSCFAVSLRTVTTVHPIDKHLDNFLRVHHMFRHADVDHSLLLDSIRNLPKSRPEPLVQFLYVVLDKLLDLIVYPSNDKGACAEAAAASFATLSQLVKILSLLSDQIDAQGRSTLLTTFVTYHRVSPQCVGAGDTPATTGRPHSGAANTGGKENSGGNNDSSLLDLIRGFERSSMRNALASNTCDQATMHFHCANGKLLYEEIAVLWNSAPHSTQQTACLNAWFFLELTIKSMAEYLLCSNRLYLPRKLRFSQQFATDITTIVRMLTEQAVKRLQAERNKAVTINRALAFFVRDALSLMDRTLVLTICKEYNEFLATHIGANADCAAALMLLKVEFNRVVCSHEHFVTLNVATLQSHAAHTASSAAKVAETRNSGSSRSPSVCSRGSLCSVNINSTSPQHQAYQSQSRQAVGPSIGCSDLTNEYRTKHFLVGLLLCDVASVLEPALCGTAVAQELQRAAVSAVCATLIAVDSDQRIQGGQSARDTATGGTSGQYAVPTPTHGVNLKHTVAMLYAPLLGIVLDSCGVLHDPYSATGGQRRRSGAMQRSCNEDVLRAISQPAPGGVASAAAAAGANTLTLHCTQGLLSTFCWVLKNMERPSACRWIGELSAVRLTQLLDVLQLCISCFEYAPRSAIGGVGQCGSSAAQQMLTRAALREAIVGSNQASKQWLRNRHSLRNRHNDAAAQDADAVRWRKETIQHRTTVHTDVSSWTSDNVHKCNADAESLIGGNLSTEITLIVLDTLELILQVQRSTDSDSDGDLVPLVTRVVLHALACEQSVRSLQCILGTQRALVFKFADVFFEQETDLCNELCLQLLRRGACPLPAVRSQAAASLYVLMRHSYEAGASFPRVKMQITVALSQLVSTSDRAIGRFSEENLRRCLKTVLMYAENDAYHGGGANAYQTNGGSPMSPLAPGASVANFSEQVKDLVFNLHMILSDTVKMKDLHNDMEMLIDLMYRIAKGYENSPDLRVTWLANMASKHEECGNWPEAAMCYTHAAALVTEYLRMMHTRHYLPVGANAFVPITENALEECAVSADVVAPNEEGVCESRHFTQEGLLRLMHLAVECFNNAHMYELMCEVYKLIVPVLEHSRDVTRLAECHLRASKALSRIEVETEREKEHNALWHLPLITGDKRTFGTYFRVGFYGALLGDLDGLEFVYREPSITKLHEISHRLELFYTQRLGDGRVEIVKDSNVVNRNNLDCNKAYLQITYVEPYFDKWELRRRRSHAERNSKLGRFVYYTPVARDGSRAHGKLVEQCKRKTVLTLAHALPYIKTRVIVVARHTTLLTPIEVAIEDVRKRTRDLAAAAARQPCDAKMLQMVLQGCIGATVNQGPIEVANVFLADGAGGHESDADAFTKHQHQLRIAFKQFSAVCADALKLNKTLIGTDRKDYQHELERNYFDFTAKLTPMVSSAGAIASMRLRRHTHQQHAQSNGHAHSAEADSAGGDAPAPQQCDHVRDNPPPA